MPSDRHEKTEKATPKRKKDARNKGQVARSADLGGWLSLLIATSAMPAVFGLAEKRLVGLEGVVTRVIANPTVPGALAVLGSGLSDAMMIILPIGAVMALLGVSVSVAQVGLNLSGHGITPKFSKLNPVQGLKRVLSKRGLWELAKSLIKMTVIGFLAYRSILGMWHTLVGTQPVAIGPLLTYAGSTLIGFVRTIAIAGFLLGVADYAYQRRKLNSDLKMTKQEVKEESKQREGDPRLKGAIRRKQRSMSRLRMMAEVARADVIITNPTHYAVALKYDRGRSSAPRVVAKGADDVAARIREAATEHGVPILEDPPLARAIFAACEIEDEIPEAMYMAVARLLAFVYALSPALRSARPVHRRPVSALVG